MSMDRDLRALRRTQQYGAGSEASARLLVARVRAGELARSSLVVAGIMGHAAARCALTGLVPTIEWEEVEMGHLANAAEAHRGLVDAWLRECMESEARPRFETVRPGDGRLGRALNGLGYVPRRSEPDGYRGQQAFEAAAMAERVVQRASGLLDDKVAGCSLHEALAAEQAAIAVREYVRGDFLGAVNALVLCRCRASVGEDMSLNPADVQEREERRLRRALAEYALRATYPMRDQVLSEDLTHRRGNEILANDDVRRMQDGFGRMDWSRRPVEVLEIAETIEDDNYATEARVSIIYMGSRRERNGGFFARQFRVFATVRGVWDWHGWSATDLHVESVGPVTLDARDLAS